MRFETRVISIDEQARLVDRVIGDYKALLGMFVDNENSDIRDGIKQDLLIMIAVRRSLSRLEAREDGQTSISVPAVDAWLRNSQTMQILTRLDAEGLPAAAQRGKISDAKPI